MCKMWSVCWLVGFVALGSVVFGSAWAQDEERLSIIKDDQLFIVKVGQKRAIFCKGSEPQKEWLNPRGEVVGRRSPTARVHSEPTSGQLVLVFDDPDSSDNGTWSCRGGEQRQTIDIYIVEEVWFGPTVPEVTATEGDSSATLRCVAHGTPQPSLNWYYGSVAIDKQTRKYRVNDDGRLQIMNVNRTDAGDYECKALQVVGKAYVHVNSTFTRLQVRHPPAFEQDMVRDLFAIINETKVLVCAAKAYPIPTYRWIAKDNPSLEITENVETAENGSKSELTVLVTSADKSYICAVTNSHGKIRTTFHISLGNKPHPPEKVIFKSATNESMDFEIICGNCTRTSAESSDIADLPITEYRIEAINMTSPDWDANSAWIVSMQWDYKPFENGTYTLEGLSPVTTYTVRVAALNLAGSSDYIDAGVLLTTSSAPAPPARPALMLSLLFLALATTGSLC